MRSADGSCVGKKQPNERQQARGPAHRPRTSAEPSIFLNLSIRALRTMRSESIREWEERAQTITDDGRRVPIPDEMMQAD